VPTQQTRLRRLLGTVGMRGRTDQASQFSAAFVHDVVPEVASLSMQD
jgi:hypothetical protein